MLLSVSGLQRHRNCKRGGKIFLSDILDRKEQVNELTDSGFSPVQYKFDVSSSEQVENMINWIVDKFGRLDFGLNNVGANHAKNNGCNYL